MATFELPAERQYVRVARTTARLDPIIVALSEPDRADVALIVSELVSNAIEAAADGTSIMVDISVEGFGLLISVSNQGVQNPRNATAAMPDGSMSRGRGLALVSMLSRELIVNQKDGRTTVRALL